jgi:branched-chain amino acid transport system substrate-binding protein
VFTACGGEATNQASAPPYVVGVLTSQTGSASQLGVGEANSVKLLAQQINKQGGISGHQLKLIVADDQSKPDQAVQEARTLLQQKALAIIGPSIVADCNAVAPLVETGPVEYCLSPGITPKEGSYVWSSSAPTSLLAQRIAGFWKSQGITKIALITTTDGSGQDGARAVRSAAQGLGGITITADVTFAPTAIEVTSQLEQIKSSNPQAIVVWSTGTPAGIALKGIQQLNLDLPVATTDGNLANAFVQRIADYTPKTFLIPATQDFWWDRLPAGSADQKLEKAYHDDYQKAYGEPPDFGPGVGYDAMLIVADALKHVGGDSSKIKTYIESLRGFHGVGGTYNFSPSDHRGLGLDYVAIVQVQNGKFVYVGK